MSSSKTKATILNRDCEQGAGAKSSPSENFLNQLVIFLKAPRLGAVKTRLAKTMGDEAALHIYRFLLDSITRNLSRLSSVELRHSPDKAGDELKPWMKKDWSRHPQGQGNLGRRLAAAFSDHFRRGAQRVVIIGSDCPEIRSSDIRRAWTALARFDLVLGPTKDGGYWLIGLRRPELSLFENISWSTPRVMAQTLGRAERAGMKICCLQRRDDIDIEADWKRFLRRNPGCRG